MTTLNDAPVDVPQINDGVPAPLPVGLTEIVEPLSTTELRLMYERVNEIHALFLELRAVKDNLPELIKQLPPPFSMMFRNFAA